MWKEKLSGESVRTANLDVLSSGFEVIKETDEEHYSNSDYHSAEPSERKPAVLTVDARITPVLLEEPLKSAKSPVLDSPSKNDNFWRETSEQSPEKKEAGALSEERGLERIQAQLLPVAGTPLPTPKSDGDPPFLRKPSAGQLREKNANGSPPPSLHKLRPAAKIQAFSKGLRGYGVSKGSPKIDFNFGDRSNRSPLKNTFFDEVSAKLKAVKTGEKRELPRLESFDAEGGPFANDSSSFSPGGSGKRRSGERWPDSSSTVQKFTK